jgi:putative DNA primase/helicase
MAAGHFDPARLPSPETYYAGQGVTLRGRGTQRLGNCLLHGGHDSFSVNLESGAYCCFNPSCDARGGDVLDFHRQLHGLEFVQAARDLGAWIEGDEPAPQETRAKPPARPVPAREREPLPEYAKTLLRGSESLQGTLGETYLRRRGCATPPPDGDLRFHPHVWHSPTRTYWPALLGVITDAITGDQMGVHRTFLAPDGSGKAPVDPARMVLGPKQGGVIRLWPDEAVDVALGIGEGIESCLSLAWVMRPTWAAIDAGNLAAVPVLPGIQALTIATDHDPAGIASAKACAERWTAAGREVRLVVPPQPGQDLNDIGGAR